MVVVVFTLNCLFVVSLYINRQSQWCDAEKGWWCVSPQCQCYQFFTGKI